MDLGFRDLGLQGFRGTWDMKILVSEGNFKD